MLISNFLEMLSSYFCLNSQTPAQVWQRQANKSKRKQPKRKVVGNENHEPVFVQAFDGLLHGVYEPPDG